MHCNGIQGRRSLSVCPAECFSISMCVRGMVNMDMIDEVSEMSAIRYNSCVAAGGLTYRRIELYGRPVTFVLCNEFEDSL